MLDQHYLDERLVKIYDHDSPWNAERDFYLSLIKQPGSRILEVGCGTGLICNELAKAGHQVTGA